MWWYDAQPYIRQLITLSKLQGTSWRSGRAEFKCQIMCLLSPTLPEVLYALIDLQRNIMFLIGIKQKWLGLENVKNHYISVQKYQQIEVILKSQKLLWIAIGTCSISTATCMGLFKTFLGKKAWSTLCIYMHIKLTNKKWQQISQSTVHDFILVISIMLVFIVLTFNVVLLMPHIFPYDA